MPRPMQNCGRRIFRLILRAASVSLAWLLGLACNNDWRVTPLYGVPEYGMPLAEYHVTGTIKARDTGAPVPGILLTIKDTSSAYPQTLDSARTDSSGRYLLEYSESPWPGVWRLTAQDVDGIVNGAFLARDTTVSIPESELSGGNGRDTVDVALDRDVP